MKCTMLSTLLGRQHCLWASHRLKRWDNAASAETAEAQGHTLCSFKLTERQSICNACQAPAVHAVFQT